MLQGLSLIILIIKFSF